MAYPIEDLVKEYGAALTAGVLNPTLCGVSLGVGRRPSAGACLIDTWVGVGYGSKT